MENLRLSFEEEGVAKYIFAGIFSAFVEAVHVELANKGVDIAVSEVFGQDVILEVIYLFDGKLSSVVHPVYDGFVVLVF